MCGIVGFMTKETKKLETDRAKFMRQGLIIDTLRGDDSTGVFGVGHEPLFDDGTAFWLKQLGGGEAMVDSEGYWTNFYDTISYRAVVGHNRAATVGAVDTAGAHPFAVGPITLVHNGTLKATHNMPTPMHQCCVPTGKEGALKAVGVDSHAVAYNLAHHDVDEVIATLEGAFTLVWHDARDDSMNIIRNSERPLHMALSNQQDTMYFMSEAGMLHLLDQRLHLGLTGIYYPKAGQWMKWLPETELDSPEVKTLELYRAPQFRGWSGGVYHGYDDDDEYDYGEMYNKGSTAMSGKPSAPATDRVHVGGRQKDVPTPLQEALLSYDLLTEDRLAFVPKMKVSSGERNSVIGEIQGKYKAMVYNLSVADSAMDRRWTVRPVGAQVTDLGEPLVICKLVSMQYLERDPLAGAVTLATATEVKKHDEIRHIGGSPYIKKAGSRVWTPFEGTAPRDDLGRAVLGYDTSYAGPNGASMTATEFMQATVDGCCLCHRQVSLADAADIAWDLAGEEFICWDCDASGLDDYYSGRIH